MIDLTKLLTAAATSAILLTAPLLGQDNADPEDWTTDDEWYDPGDWFDRDGEDYNKFEGGFEEHDDFTWSDEDDDEFEDDLEFYGDSYYETSLAEDDMGYDYDYVGGDFWSDAGWDNEGYWNNIF